MARGDEAGQASLEVLAGVPLLIAAALLCLQMMAVGFSASVVDGAVEAGALAAASGRPGESAALAALPDWARERAEVESRGGWITVRLHPPAVLEALSRALEVRSSAWVRRPEGDR